MAVVPVALSAIAAFGAIRMNVPGDLRSAEARARFWGTFREVLHKRLAGAPSLLDPVEDMEITAPEFRDLLDKSVLLQSRITGNALHGAADREGRLEAYAAKVELGQRCGFLRDRIAAARTLAQRDTLRRMKRVLRRLGHIDADNVVQTKGRVACEINTADELLCTELVFNGVFNDLDDGQAAALLSCLVFTEKGEAEEVALREGLAAPLRALQDAARRIAQVSRDCKVELDVEEYVASFRSDMMELVYAWVGGAKFVDICAMTKQFEGSIIRVIRRLEELCRQLSDAAKAIGDESLQAKFKGASAKMRRDVIFAASLYL